MMRVQVYNINTGEVLGTYQGATRAEVLDAMAVDHGFPNYDAIIVGYGVSREDAIAELEFTAVFSMGDAVKAAYEADAAFALAIKAAGYKSRWDWNQAQDSRPMAAYVTKVLADEAMYESFGTTS
jgi:hypothetical protein